MTTTQQSAPAYKFLDLKAYATNEWLYGSKKRYREVFDQMKIRYSETELLAIAKNILSESELTFDAEAEEHFGKHIKALCIDRDKFYGNAREIRKAIEETVKNQNLRLADLPKDKRTKKMISMVMIDDVKEFSTEMKGEKQGFGFSV